MNIWTVLRKPAAIAALGMAWFALAAGEETTRAAAPPREPLLVMGVVIVSTNEVMPGANTISPPEATNIIARYRGGVEAIAIHGSVETNARGRATSSSAAEILCAGVPLVFVEKDGGYYSWREQSGDHEGRTLKLGTDYVGVLRRFWSGEKNEENTSAGPILRATFNPDADAGSYGLKGIDLGFFGQRVWLIYTHHEADDESDAFGVRVKKAW